MKSMKDSPTVEENYIFEFWWIVSIVGEISSNLLVNSHKYNTTPPERIDDQIQQTINRLKQFQIKYRKQFKDVNFSIER